MVRQSPKHTKGRIGHGWGRIGHIEGRTRRGLGRIGGESLPSAYGVVTTNALSWHPGDPSLNSLTWLSAEVSEVLAKHEKGLAIDGPKEHSDEAT